MYMKDQRSISIDKVHIQRIVLSKKDSSGNKDSCKCIIYIYIYMKVMLFHLNYA